MPEAHFLETWSDVRADDGTVTIVQPLIAPLYGGKSAHEVLAAFSDGGERSGYDIVREYWASRRPVHGGAGALPPAVGASSGAAPAGHAAGAAGAAPRPRRRAGRRRAAARAVAVRPALAPLAARRRRAGHRVRAEDGDAAGARCRRPPRRAGDGLEVVFRPDPSVYDGRFANNAWLQELPKSLTKLTWDNAALIAPAHRRAPRRWSAATSSS